MIRFLLVSFLTLLPNLVLADHPNVVVFLADDAGWGDLSHSGNRMVATPRIDSIAKEGVSLESFFVQPVCAPTRAEFLTGRWHGRSGVRGVSSGLERLDLSERTIADAFHSAGYATGAFGKWHNGSQWPYHPRARGFDEYFGYSSGHWGEYFDAPLEENGRMTRTHGYIVDVCTDRALEFIKRSRNKPFFCYVAFTTPHTPWAVPAEDWARFQDKPILQRATDASREIADETRCALAMMENQDFNVGRVLDCLKQQGLHDNTIVVYFSDNGPNSHRWNGGMKGKKGSNDEGGVRSVCYMRWPKKIPKAHSVSQISGAVDLLPTLTSLAGVGHAGQKLLDGRDLTPLLMKQSTDWPDRMLFNTWAAGASVRNQTHRLDAAGQLFDMIADPGQKSPINKQHPELAKKLTDELEKWRRDVYGENVDPAPPKAANQAGLGSNPGTAIDPRPIPVGYPEFPVTMLPARDGQPFGQVQRSSTAPNCSYFVDWTTKKDRMVWLVEVHSAGTYSVAIDYTCKLLDAGSTIEVSCLDAKLTGKVMPGWDPPLYENQDTLPRPPGESRMKDFATLALGTIRLPAGQGPLVLRALDIPGESVMDVRRITLTLLEENL
ncbi:MAG: arylsulfatase [Pirellula sp.]